MTRAILQGLDRLIFPPQCLLCDSPFERFDALSLCPGCRDELLREPFPTCPRCAATVGPNLDLSDGCVNCREKSFQFESVLRLGPYDGKLRTAILKSKRLDGEILAESLAALWAQRDRERLLALRPDVIVPVPLHWFRRIERGYNQSRAFADSLGTALRCPVLDRALVRRKPTPKQFTLSATARRENVAGAFRMNAWSSVRNMRVLLIDDVMTTGATSNEAAKVLKAAGAAQVVVAVVARR